MPFFQIQNTCAESFQDALPLRKIAGNNRRIPFVSSVPKPLQKASGKFFVTNGSDDDNDS